MGIGLYNLLDGMYICNVIFQIFQISSWNIQIVAISPSRGDDYEELYQYGMDIHIYIYILSVVFCSDGDVLLNDMPMGTVVIVEMVKHQNFEASGHFIERGEE